MVQTRSQTRRPLPVPESQDVRLQGEGREGRTRGSRRTARPPRPTAGASPLRIALRIALVLFALYSAYHIRLFAIQNYGLVIHEFDPWFNYRATVYLRDHGVEAFFKWYDHKVWYPLGRPVGTTIYPGMQLTSVAIWNALGADDSIMSLNDVCCYVPAWFSVLDSVPRPARVRVHRVRGRRRFRKLPHGRRARPHHAIRRRRLRQRVDCHDGHVRHVLLLGTESARERHGGGSASARRRRR